MLTYFRVPGWSPASSENSGLPLLGVQRPVYHNILSQQILNMLTNLNLCFALHFCSSALVHGVQCMPFIDPNSRL